MLFRSWQGFLGPFNFYWKYKNGPDDIADTLSHPPGLEDAMETTRRLLHMSSIAYARVPTGGSNATGHPRVRKRSVADGVHVPGKRRRRSVTHSASFAAEHMVDAEYTDTPSVSHFDAPSRLTEFERSL